MEVPRLIIICDGILPLLSGIKPIKFPLCITSHEKLVPWVAELRITACVDESLHSVCSATGISEGKGFTKIVSATEGPAQAFAVGVIV